MASTNFSLSVEQTPAKINKGDVSEYVLNNADYITIPHLPNNSLKITTKTVIKMSDTHGVDPSRVIPHIAARSVPSKAELTRQLKNLNDLGVRNLIVVGGNPKNPVGPYTKDHEVLERARKIFDPRTKIYCGVYPQDESPSGVYLTKFGRFGFDGGVSQVCLSQSKIELIKLNTRIGVPSKADWNGLWRYMKLCGVGPSIRHPLRNVGGILHYMTMDGFDTTRFVEDLQPHRDFHIYDFGRLEETVEELIALDV